MHRCRSILVPAVVAALLGVVSLLSPATLPAATLSAQQAATASRIAGLQKRIADLDDTSKAVATHLEVTQIQLASLRVALQNAQAAYDQQRTAFDQRLVAIYKNGSDFKITLLTGARDLNDFIVRMRWLATIVDADRRTLISLQEQKMTVAQAKARMEQIESEQSQLLVLQRSQLAEKRARLRVEKRLLTRISAKIKAWLAAQRRRLALADAARRRNNKPLGAEIRSVWATVDGYPDQRFLTAYDNPIAYKAVGVKQDGISSWYGNEFHGRPTSSGETFNENDFTAAHRTLPFGTYLAVRYEGRGIIVRITDRGPFISGRILDLSKRAARELGIDGIGFVRTEVVSPK